MAQSFIMNTSQGPVAAGPAGGVEADSGAPREREGPAVFASSAAPFWRGWNILAIAAGVGLSAGCAFYAVSHRNEVHPWLLTATLAASMWMLFCIGVLIWRCVHARFHHSEMREDGILMGGRFWSWEQIFEIKAERTWFLGWYQPVFFVDRYNWTSHLMPMEWPMTPFQYRLLMLRLRKFLGRVHPHVMLEDPFGDQQVKCEAICLKCGYDLRATPERCPECGMVPDGRMVGVRVARADGGMGIPI